MQTSYKHVVYVPREGGLLSVTATTLVVIAAGIWIYDVTFYLRTGSFHLLNTLLVMYDFGLFQQWIQRPESWHGLHGLLAKIPLSFSFLTAGLVLAAIDFHND